MLIGLRLFACPKLGLSRGPQPDLLMGILIWAIAQYRYRTADPLAFNLDFM